MLKMINISTIKSHCKLNAKIFSIFNEFLLLQNKLIFEFLALKNGPFLTEF